MGFFKKLFKRKKGGTFFGNLLRKGASVATGGILGNGVDLANWEAKQDAKDLEAQQKAQANLLSSLQKQKLAIDKAKRDLVTSKEAAPITNVGAKAWFARNWKKAIIPVVIVIAGVVYLFKRKGKKGRRRRR